MTEFEAKVLSDLNVVKAQMEQLMGIGQPGRLHHLEERVASNERLVQRLKGVTAAFGAALTVMHLAISYFASGKHQ